MLTYTQQVRLCLRRSFWRIAAEPAQPVFELSANIVMALAFASVFYNLSSVRHSATADGAYEI